MRVEEVFREIDNAAKEKKIYAKEVAEYLKAKFPELRYSDNSTHLELVNAMFGRPRIDKKIVDYPIVGYQVFGDIYTVDGEVVFIYLEDHKNPAFLATPKLDEVLRAIREAKKKSVST
jgi:hypothetical protein